MARIQIEGFLKRWEVKQGKGVILLIQEKRHNRLEKPTWFRVAAWGKKAEAIAPHLRQGQMFSLTCEVSTRTVKGSTYTNYSLLLWRLRTFDRKKMEEACRTKQFMDI